MRSTGIFICAVLITLSGCAAPFTSGVSDETLLLPGREMINRYWAAYRPLPVSSLYAEVPSHTAPYSAGAASAGLRANGLRMANFVRFLAGLPADLVLDQELNDLAQHGAVLLKAHGTLTHEPAKPADMEQEFFDRGRSSTTSANIASGYHSLSSSIRNGYMEDDSSSNITTVGHRRWILNPALQKLGFGYCEGFSTIQVIDKSRTAPFDYRWIAWPVGEFPVTFFDSNDPWSLTLNTADYYQQPAAGSVSVTLERLGTNSAVWTLDSNDSSYTATNEYFTVNNGGYGINNCIIFRPDSTFTCNPGESYRVTVSGISDKAGNPTNLTYTVNFFALETPQVNPLGAPARTIDNRTGMPQYAD